MAAPSMPLRLFVEVPDAERVAELRLQGKVNRRMKTPHNRKPQASPMHALGERRRRRRERVWLTDVAREWVFVKKGRKR